MSINDATSTSLETPVLDLSNNVYFFEFQRGTEKAWKKVVVE
jgi:hypothetical protein